MILSVVRRIEYPSLATPLIYHITGYVIDEFLILLII